MGHAGPKAPGHEGQMRIRVLRLHLTLLGIEVVAAFQPVVLVSGALRKKGPEGFDVARDVLGSQPRREPSIEKTRRRVRRPIETLGKGPKGLVFGRKTGPQLHQVKTRLGEELQRDIERLRGRQALVWHPTCR